MGLGLDVLEDRVRLLLGALVEGRRAEGPVLDLAPRGLLPCGAAAAAAGRGGAAAGSCC